MPFVSGILIYPIKSLDGVQLTETMISSGGSLLCDRLYAIVNDNGKYVNGKHEPKVHRLRVRYIKNYRTIIIRIDERQEYTFSLPGDIPGFERWLSEYFGYTVHLKENAFNGFPDDTHALGPTIIGRQTLETVSSWFSGIDEGALIKRFRPNIIIDGAVPFWEDRLYGDEGTLIDFIIGDVRFEGLNPCQRCVVPTRDPETGGRYEEFQKIFMKQREETLPKWAPKKRFNHFYHLSVNTFIPLGEKNKKITVGDEVRIIGTRIL
jgi:uncharacterized protein YcbX